MCSTVNESQSMALPCDSLLEVDTSVLVSTIGALPWVSATDTDSILWLYVLFATGSCAFILWFVCFKPFYKVKDLTSVGYGPVLEQGKGRRRALVANEARKRRQKGDFPPVYPNGWFAIADVKDIPSGKPLLVQALGENFAVFSSLSKETVHVVDAYCPHLGANMAVGGRVVGNDCIECPFHGWLFSGHDGSCVSVPYTEKVPTFAKVRVWPNRVIGEVIFIWYHAEREPPLWEIESPPQITDGVWTQKGTSIHFVNCHIQEVPENGADIAHLNILHEPAVFGGADLRSVHGSFFQSMKHRWSADWAALPPPKEHMTEIAMTHEVQLFGRFVTMSLKISVQQIGPALVYLKVYSPLLGNFLMMQTVTPQEPLVQKIQHRVFAPRWFPNFFVASFLHSECVMLERDIMVWNHKMYLKRPCLPREDRNIARFRKWYSQFYSENSRKLCFFDHGSLDW
ncbi:unnamed protein product [Cyprideis torosa]|uniref:cholesterol 7-desaturase n=1 Tax=Cyprideis torosa TaxID=163714 RepID=A0A7R8W7M2_9CRUS|nr:unnamed protein product [Cyprideis torosa]CAG0882321.1 unnamed protein product [Cyprideis torosa]